MKNSGIHKICIIPWIHLEKSYAMGKYRLLRFPEDFKQEEDFKSCVFNILKSYRDISGNSREKCMIVSDGGEVSWSISGEDKDVIDSITLFFLSAISMNEYKRPGLTYSNSTCFRPVFHQLNLSSKSFTLIRSARNGIVKDMGWQIDKLTIGQPLEVVDAQPELDINLLNALSICGEKFRERIVLATKLLANGFTDSPYVDNKVEFLILFASLVQLVNVDQSFKFSEKLAKLFAEYSFLKILDLKRSDPTQILSQYSDGTGKNQDYKPKEEWTILQLFFYEICQIRNEILHLKVKYPTKAWSINEHLVMISFLFPLIVKLLLNEDGNYALSEDDNVKCSLVEHLLQMPDWWGNEDKIEDPYSLIRNCWETLEDKANYKIKREPKLKELYHRLINQKI